MVILEKSLFILLSLLFVKGCQEWSGGGHYCVHMIQHLREKEKEEKLRKAKKAESHDENFQEDREMTLWTEYGKSKGSQPL